MTRRILAIIALASGLSVPAVPVRGAVVEIPALRDNTLFDFAADTLSSSGAGPHLFAGDNSGSNTRRALIAFAVADSIPQGSVVEAVELRLTVTQTPNEGAHEVCVHRLTANWGEGASSSSGGAGAAPAAGDATWVHRFFPDLPWTTPGGDFVAAPSAVSIVATPASYLWSGEGLVEDVQLWVDQAAISFGWILVGEEGTASSVKRFSSRENGDAASRPRLLVTYDPPDVPVRATSWGNLKSGFRRDAIPD